MDIQRGWSYSPSGMSETAVGGGESGTVDGISGYGSQSEFMYTSRISRTTTGSVSSVGGVTSGAVVSLTSAAVSSGGSVGVGVLPPLAASTHRIGGVPPPPPDGVSSSVVSSWYVASIGTGVLPVL